MFALVDASFAKQSTLNQIYQLTHKHCRDSLRSGYNQSLANILSRLPSRSHAKSASQVTIPPACKNNFNSWLAGLAFNLNLFALDKKASARSLENITPLLSIRTFGKTEYLQLAQSWQKLAETNYSIKNLNDFFSVAVKKNYRALAILGAAFLYLQFILDGQEHDLARDKALADFYSFRHIQDMAFIEKKTIEILQKKYNKEVFATKNILHNIKTKVEAEQQEKLEKAQNQLENSNNHKKTKTKDRKPKRRKLLKKKK